MQRDRQKPKYGQLEATLSNISGEAVDQKGLRHKIIMAFALAPMRNIPHYMAISNVLHLDETQKRDLKELHDSMLIPIQKYLDAIRPMVVCSFRNVNNGTLTRELKAKEFDNMYSVTYDSERLKESEYIKRLIVYPLLISTLNTWRKYDSGFSTKLIDVMKVKEDNIELRKYIDLLDSTPTPRNFIRN